MDIAKFNIVVTRDITAKLSEVLVSYIEQDNDGEVAVALLAHLAIVLKNVDENDKNIILNWFFNKMTKDDLDS